MINQYMPDYVLYDLETTGTYLLINLPFVFPNIFCSFAFLGLFQEKDAHTVLGGDYAGSGKLQEVIPFMHNAPTAAKKEFYIVKTLSVEKETIARNFENGAASQGAVLRIGSLRFFLKQS